MRLTIATLVLAASLIPANAIACSCFSDAEHRLLVGDALPANGSFIVWHQPESSNIDGGPSNEPPTITATDADGNPVDVSVVEAYVTFPSVNAGEVVTVVSQSDQLGSTVEQTIRIDAPVALDIPFELAVSDTQHGPLQVAEPASSCDEVVEAAWVDIRAVSDDLAPYADALVTTLYRDGVPYRFSSSDCEQFVPAGQTSMRVARNCAHSGGARDIELRSSFPGTALEWRASTRLELRCSDDSAAGGCATASGRGELEWPALVPVVFIFAGLRRRR